MVVSHFQMPSTPSIFLKWLDMISDLHAPPSHVVASNVCFGCFGSMELSWWSHTHTLYSARQTNHHWHATSTEFHVGFSTAPFFPLVASTQIQLAVGKRCCVSLSPPQCNRKKSPWDVSFAILSICVCRSSRLHIFTVPLMKLWSKQLRGGLIYNSIGCIEVITMNGVFIAMNGVLNSRLKIRPAAVKPTLSQTHVKKYHHRQPTAEF